MQNALSSYVPRDAAAGSAKTAAKICFGATIVFVALVTLLHFVEPEFGPMWRFVSEYSTGPHGWLMKLAFFVMAAGCAAAVMAIRPQIRGKAGSVGLFFLALTVAGLIMAGLFDQDPITSNTITREGNLHAFATMLGIPGFTLASLVLGVHLARRNERWRGVRTPLLLLSQLPWILFLAMFAYMSVAMPRAGGFGPAVWVGLLNRLYLAAMCGWLLFVAAHARGDGAIAGDKV